MAGSRQPPTRPQRRQTRRRAERPLPAPHEGQGRAGAPLSPGGRRRQPPPTDAGDAERATPLGLRLSQRGAGQPPPRGAGSSSSPPQAWREGDGPGPASPPRRGAAPSALPAGAGQSGAGPPQDPPTNPSPWRRGQERAGTSPAQHMTDAPAKPITFQPSLPAAQWRRGAAAPGGVVGKCSPAEGRRACPPTEENYVSRQAVRGGRLRLEPRPPPPPREGGERARPLPFLHRFFP